MTSKVLYSNSNEISSLIESTSTWSVSPMGCLDDLVGPTSLLLFDTLFYQLPVEWTVNELLEKRPEWEQQILPLLKAHQFAYLFTKEWCLMLYVKELDKILFQSISCTPIALENRDCFLSTQSLTFGMRQEIRSLIEPAVYVREASERLSANLKRPVDLGVPTFFQDVGGRLEELVMELDREVSDWKDQFFFDALDAHENDLCHECKENMRVAFYVSNDRSQALKWRPHGDWCSHKNCKYFKFDIFNDLYTDDVRGTPSNMRGFSD